MVLKPGNKTLFNMHESILNPLALIVLGYTDSIYLACTFLPEKTSSFDTGKVFLLFIIRISLKEQFITNCCPSRITYLVLAFVVNPSKQV